MLLQKCKIQVDLSLAKNWSFDHECNRGNGAAHLMAEILYLIADIGCVNSSCLCCLLCFCLSERAK